MNIAELEETVKQFGGIFRLCEWDYEARLYPVLINATNGAVLWECSGDHFCIDFCLEQIEYFKENQNFASHLPVLPIVWRRSPNNPKDRPFLG